MATVDSHRRNVSRKNQLKFLQYLVLFLIVIIILIPLVVQIFGSLKTRGEMYSQPYIPPTHPHWENYGKILKSSSFWIMLRNSLTVMLATTIIVLFSCSLAAFVFARMNFRGKNFGFNFLTLGLMFPITIAILPVYLSIRQMGLPNTLLGVILVQTAFQLSGNIMILRGSFMEISFELQDAAYIDGCTAVDFFWRILIPLARPALSAVAALTMIASWNDLLVPLVIVDSEALWTLPLGTMQFQGQYGTDLALVAAFTTLSAIPTILFYLIAERQIVAGLTAGALKG